MAEESGVEEGKKARTRRKKGARMKIGKSEINEKQRKGEGEEEWK